MRSDSQEGDHDDRQQPKPSERPHDSHSGEGAASAMAHMKRQRRQHRRQAGEDGRRDHGS